MGRKLKTTSTSVKQILSENISRAFRVLFTADLPASEISLQPTKKTFVGHYTFITFAYVKLSGKKPGEIGTLVGNYLKENVGAIKSFNLIKGFLNLEITDSVWVDTLADLQVNAGLKLFPKNGKKVMVEYSSPNTNKPLHLGHLRNNFLGFSIARIMEARGYEVMKTNLVNDKGIHICKSMLAYEKFGYGEVPSKDLKGDKLVGNYYVKFDQEYKKQIKELLAQYRQKYPDAKLEQLKEKAEKNAPLLLEAQAMLKKWEAGDKATKRLWQQMNAWVYAGFDTTYQAIGVSFDKIYYESQTYLSGKEILAEGLEKGIFYQKPDGSVWIDLSAQALDKKLLLRADGTSVYITQDLGTADLKYRDFPMEKSIYVVGNEQDYHFKVLQCIMAKLGRNYSSGIYHLSYGMVDLPSGKMKSREGTVVDADDLILEMVETAKARTADLGKIDDFTSAEAQALYRVLALGALKYYLLRVDAQKRILFNPEESIDFQGNTGVYIQYTFAKINAIIRKASKDSIKYHTQAYQLVDTLLPVEVEVIMFLTKYPDKVCEAAEDYSTAVLANYVYDLARIYSKFYAEVPIFKDENQALISLRIALSAQVANVLQKAMGLLGIDLPTRM